MKENITGIVLAGGKSTRMGTDKAALIINQHSLLEHTFNILKNVCSNVFVSGNYSSQFPSITDLDEYKERGPIGGIYSCFKYFEKNNSFPQKILIIPTDMPKLSIEILKSLIEHSNQSNDTFDLYHYKGFEFPILLNNPKSYLIKLNQLLSDTNIKCSIKNLIKMTKSFSIELSNQAIYNYFLNTNTPIEWQEYLNGVKNETENK